MCKFMSVCSDGKGKLYYFKWSERKRILSGKLNYDADSHVSIADFYGFRGKGEDRLNKYEWNLLTHELKIDMMNVADDFEKVKNALLRLDFRTVVPQLVVKEIFNPFSIEAPRITMKHITLMKRWDSVWASVRDSVRASVGDSVWDSVGDSVGVSMWDSVRDSVGASVGDSVWDSVGDSVWDSVWAYIGSFFRLTRKSWKYTGKIRCRGYPFQPAVDLWMQGLIPVYDGKKWTLFGKKNGRVQCLYELKPKPKKEKEEKG